VRVVEQTADGQAPGTVVYAAVEKTGHHRSVADLEARSEPAPPAPGASVMAVMRHRLRTGAGQTLYQPRQQTVEPVLGIIKSLLWLSGNFGCADGRTRPGNGRWSAWPAT
jgi:hypothetical protein